MTKIVLFELNEVPWRVIEDFVQTYPDSALARLAKCSRRYETYAEDSELSPWVTWPSLHRGVSDQKHEISNFGQNLEEVDQEYPAVWQILAANGVSTGVFGSLHTHPLPNDLSNYAFMIPDVFAAGSECFPRSVEAYQHWNLTMSRSSARNVSSGIPLRETAGFLRSLPDLGLRPKTMMNLGMHLIDERREKWKKVRRRTHQVLIAYDVFLKQLAKTKPAFSTFFTNHVASTMHRYWAAKYPDDYSVFGYSDDWQSTYNHEIDWTIGKFDDMLKRLLNFIEHNKDYELWVASSMGQAATRADNVSSTQTYVDDLATFMNHFGFSEEEYSIKPAMAPRVIIELDDKSKTAAFIAATRNIEILGVKADSLGPGESPTVAVKSLGKGVFMIRASVIQNHTEERVAVGDDVFDFSTLGIRNVEVADQSGQTAYHIPQGSLMIYSPNNDYSNRLSQSISALDVAPMILENYDIKRPLYMNKPFDTPTNVRSSV